MEKRIEMIDVEIKDLWKEVDILKEGHNKLDNRLELIKKDMEYTRKSLDKIDGNVELLTKTRFSDHYEEPLKEEKAKKARRISQAEGVAIGILVAFILLTLFPMLAR